MSKAIRLCVTAGKPFKQWILGVLLEMQSGCDSLVPEEVSIWIAAELTASCANGLCTGHRVCGQVWGSDIAGLSCISYPIGLDIHDELHSERGELASCLS